MLGVKACGISGKDGGMLKVEKKYSKGEDIEIFCFFYTFYL